MVIFTGGGGEGGAAAMLIVHCFEVFKGVGEVESCTVTVTWNGPETFGVPEIWAPLSTRPPGNPDADQV